MNQEIREFPSVTVQATGVILNPWFDFPSHAKIDDRELIKFSEPRYAIAPSCLIDLKEQGLRLLFQDDVVVFVFLDEQSESNLLFHPILYYLAYKTFINYNLIGPLAFIPAPITINKVDIVNFNITRVVQKEVDVIDNDRAKKRVSYLFEKYHIQITSASLQQYIRVLNPTFFYSLAFYLIGCENQRYFLIEFYKAVEAIKNAFKNEDEFLKALQPYGVSKSSFKKFRKICNDMRLAPLNIGRHAPFPGVKLFSIDLKYLLVEPRSREVLENSTTFCRSVIDAYIAHLDKNIS